MKKILFLDRKDLIFEERPFSEITHTDFRINRKDFETAHSVFFIEEYGDVIVIKNKDGFFYPNDVIDKDILSNFLMCTANILNFGTHLDIKEEIKEKDLSYVSKDIISYFEEECYDVQDIFSNKFVIVFTQAGDYTFQVANSKNELKNLLIIHYMNNDNWTVVNIYDNSIDKAIAHSIDINIEKD